MSTRDVASGAAGIESAGREGGKEQRGIAPAPSARTEVDSVEATQWLFAPRGARIVGDTEWEADALGALRPVAREVKQWAFALRRRARATSRADCEQGGAPGPGAAKLTELARECRTAGASDDRARVQALVQHCSRISPTRSMMPATPPRAIGAAGLPPRAPGGPDCEFFASRLRGARARPTGIPARDSRRATGVGRAQRPRRLCRGALEARPRVGRSVRARRDRPDALDLRGLRPDAGCADADRDQRPHRHGLVRLPVDVAGRALRRGRRDFRSERFPRSVALRSSRSWCARCAAGAGGAARPGTTSTRPPRRSCSSRRDSSRRGSCATGPRRSGLVFRSARGRRTRTSVARAPSLREGALRGGTGVGARPRTRAGAGRRQARLTPLAATARAPRAACALLRPVAMQTQTIGEFLLRRLEEAGVRHVFGVAGDYDLEFLQQLEDRGRPTPGSATATS